MLIGKTACLEDIAYRSLSIRSRKDMEYILREVAKLVPATGIVAGIPFADPRSVPLLDSNRIVNGGFPRSWLSLYLKEGSILSIPCS